MRKEAVLAVFSGLIVGAIIAFGVWRANSAINHTASSTSIADSPDNSGSANDNIDPKQVTLLSPEDLDVLEIETVEIKGLAKPASTLVISSQDSDYILQAKENGEFSQQIKLNGGLNWILVAEKSDNLATQSYIRVAYSSQISPNQETDSPESASDEAEINDELIRQEIEKKKNKAKAIIGTITDKTEDSIQLNDEQSNIHILAINPDSASFVKVNGKTTNATYEDVAIGDYIIAMGYLDQENILDTKRVIISSKIEKPDRQIIFAEISSIEVKTVNLLTSDNLSYKLGFPKRWQGPEISELEEGMEIAVIGVVDQKDNSLFNLRTIEKINN